MKQEEAVKIFDLVVKGQTLPETLDKLVPLSFIGSAAVTFYKAKVKLMDQLGMSEEQRKVTLRDGQDAGEMLLQIEARIGELLPQAEEARKQGQKDGRAVALGKIERSSARPPDITEKQAHHARTIAKNPAAVKAVIAEAKANEDIPTKTAVLNKIQADKAKVAAAKYKKEAEAIKEKSNIEAKGEALIYLSKLREIVHLLPAMPPKDGWSETSIAEAKAMVELIRKRLEKW